LLIVLHNLGWSNARRIRIASELASGAPLAQEIPTLIEFHLECPESLLVTIGEFPLPVQLMLPRFDTLLPCSESMRRSPPQIAPA